MIDAGLPAVARLNEVMSGQARPRNDVPAPAVPGHDLVPVAVFEPTKTDPGADRGQRFAPFNPHRRRLRSARGVLVGAMVVAAALLLGVAVNDLLLSDPLSATGVVQPNTEAQLNMSATGPIASLPVHVGEMVHSGQVLASQDTTAITAKLSADQSKLAADQAMLQQQQAGTQTVQLQQLKDQVSTAQVQQITAQQKLNQTEVTTDASVAAAQEQVQADQTLLTADQQTYTDEEPQCLSATPPAACGTDQRQVQVDQGNLMSAQSGYNQSLAQQQAQIGAAQSGVTEATAAVSTAQAALAVGSAPATAQEIAGTQAAIQQDNANIATDRTHLAQAVLTAPFNGVISAIDGSVGEVATSQGIRQATAPGSVSQPSSTGIQIFPQGPQNQTNPAPTYAALVSLESTQTKLVVQIPETDIHQIHTGQKAEASLPAVSGSTMAAAVTQIQPTPVTQSGQTYFLVDLVTTLKAPISHHVGGASTDPPAPPQVGLTVDVSF